VVENWQGLFVSAFIVCLMLSLVGTHQELQLLKQGAHTNLQLLKDTTVLQGSTINSARLDSTYFIHICVAIELIEGVGKIYQQLQDLIGTLCAFHYFKCVLICR
jgi:hypothetical protein